MTLSTEGLLAAARELTGIAMDDVDAHEPLEILVKSLNTEAQLSASGLVAMEQRLLRLLANRLRMERDFAAHPEIHEIRITAPVFVFGLPRTGTTKLQKLLSITGDFTSLPLWMAHNPSLMTGDRGEDSGWRVADTENYVKWIDTVSPGVRMVHQFDVDEPEEVNPILEQGFLSAYLPAFVEVPSYIAWYAAQEPTKQLDYLRRVLQYLQWQFSIDATKPWVLKNPTFIGMEPALKAVFPDARLVVTHRHPENVISSSASLIESFHKLYSDIDVSATAGQMMLEGQAWVAQQHLRNRIECPALDIVDVAYGELTKDSLATVERIYEHLGIPFSDSARQRIQVWEQDHRQHKFGIHRYSLSDFGLSPGSVEEKFGSYIAKFSSYF